MYYFYDEKGQVNLIYYIEPPIELLNKKYIKSDKVFEEKKGFSINYKVDLATLELTAKYIPIPLTQEEEIKQLKQEVASLKNQVNIIVQKFNNGEILL